MKYSIILLLLLTGCVKRICVTEPHKIVRIGECSSFSLNCGVILDSDTYYIVYMPVVGQTINAVVCK